MPLRSLHVHALHHRPVVTAASMGQSGDLRPGGSPLVSAVNSALGRARKAAAYLRHRRVERSCLARAVYFEARSEPLLGQFAVATVVLNRVAAPNYPASICAVVYQGSSRRNGCQFSFACDGKSDVPKSGRAWLKADVVADEVLKDNQAAGEALKPVSNATCYHADYVEPRWSRSLTRLTRIGHHIFYAQGQSS